MKLLDAIRTASSEHEIGFLLTAYVESVAYDGRLRDPEGHMRRLPVAGLEDVRVRSAALQAELARPSWSARAPGRSAVEEAEVMFTAALQRMRALGAAEHRKERMTA